MKVVKIKKIDYLGEDLEFGAGYCFVNIYLEDDKRLNTNIIHRTINKRVLEVLLKTNEMPFHMIDQKYKNYDKNYN